eukprot:COSAG03_NODE_9307_length_730_cov_4.790808_2_plen_170_part_01
MPARAAQSDVCVKPHTMNVNPASISNISGISSCPVRGGGGGTEQGGLLEWGVAEAGTRGRQAQRETAQWLSRGVRARRTRSPPLAPLARAAAIVMVERRRIAVLCNAVAPEVPVAPVYGCARWLLCVNGSSAGRAKHPPPLFGFCKKLLAAWTVVVLREHCISTCNPGGG